MADIVPLVAQIASAERELKYRIRLYPTWVERGRITQATATHELLCMRAIVASLQQLERSTQQLPLEPERGKFG